VLEQPEAIATLFRLKQRPTSVALPVLVDARETIDALGVEWPGAATRLSDQFWPGPLTIVVAVDTQLATSVGGSGTIGFRIPRDELVLDVLRACGPLAVSSANEHGEPPCQSVVQVVAALGSNALLDAVLDGGIRRGEVSTVVEIVHDTWRILRDGAIGAEEIERALA
jgi:tRNA threonylcarbamoyl adenosine modification protein (Sua5/YciO/YrdC/YwlC family)